MVSQIVTAGHRDKKSCTKKHTSGEQSTETKTRSHWPTLLGFQGMVEKAYICIISASNWPAVTKFASWVRLTGCNSCVEFDLLFMVTGVKMDKKLFGKTRVAQIVTGVHRLIILYAQIAHPDRAPKNMSPWPTLLGFKVLVKINVKNCSLYKR